MQAAKLTTEKLDIDDSNFPLREVEGERQQQWIFAIMRSVFMSEGVV